MPAPLLERSVCVLGALQQILDGAHATKEPTAGFERVTQELRCASTINYSFEEARWAQMCATTPCLAKPVAPIGTTVTNTDSDVKKKEAITLSRIPKEENYIQPFLVLYEEGRRASQQLSRLQDRYK